MVPENSRSVRVRRILLVLALASSACGEDRPPAGRRADPAPSDSVVGQWEYDVEAGRTQEPRRREDRRPFPYHPGYETPAAFGADGRYWEGAVPGNGVEPRPEGRWARRSDGSYVVTFTEGERAGRTMTFRVEEESLVFGVHDEPGRFYYYSRSPSRGGG
jgi:hypothetical protein